MADQLRFLIVEDLPTDAELVQREVLKSFPSAEFHCVETCADYLAELATFRPDVILCDYRLAGFDGLTALKLVQEQSPGTPFILITGSINEETAVSSMKAGAWDYILKDRLRRLGTAIAGALTQQRERAIHRRAADELRENEERLRLALQAANQGLYDLNVQTGEAVVSPEYARMLGYDLETFVETNAAWHERLHPDDRDQVYRVYQEYVTGQRDEYRVEFRQRTSDGRWVWILSLGRIVARDAEGQPLRMLGTHTDITARKHYEEELEHQATHDALTGLANRNLLFDRLMQNAHYADRSHRLVAVLLFDLDRFKIINDSLGHAAGDELLTQVAQRLASMARAGDTVARLGGDEFVVTLAEVAGSVDVVVVTKKFLAAFAPPFTTAGRELHINASIGISLYPKDGQDAETLLRCADIAMYQAKSEGGNTFRFFAEEMNRRMLETMELEADLRKAVAQQELLLYYQAKVDLVTGSICGAEALLRWPHATRGMISPAHFIPLAEETGLILPIGAWVLNTVCARLKAWQTAGLPPLSVAVNLSARQFQTEELENTIQQALQNHHLDPRWLELEVTESMLMRHPEKAIETMRKLKTLGLSLSLDDFGTGFSSLNYLRRFPVDNLKIDRSFITDAATDTSAASVATSIVAIARSLGMRSIAEGVETVALLNFLRACGCDEMQGYYFSRPLPEEEFITLLRTRKRLEMP